MSQPRTIFPTLFANQHIKSILGQDIISGTNGHAYILEGPKGSGRHTAARNIAAAVNCENRTDDAHPCPCGMCLFCRKAFDDISPDIHYIRREEDKASLGVDAIRMIREDLYIAPNENERKIYIIEEAELMTGAAQNALLLSLEEPPPYVVFLLLTANADMLLETIRSRAPLLRMQIFPPDTVVSYLVETQRYANIAKTEKDFFDTAVTASGGTLGRAKLLLDRDTPETADYLRTRTEAVRITRLLFHHDAKDAAQLLLSLPKSREDVITLLRLTGLALRDLTVIKKNADTPLLLYISADECKDITARISMSRICSAWDDVAHAISDTQANGSIQTIFTTLIMKKH